jgi:hypothetical protein
MPDNDSLSSSQHEGAQIEGSTGMQQDRLHHRAVLIVVFLLW